MNNHKVELINAKHRDLHREIALMSESSQLVEKEGKKLAEVLERKLAKRLGIKNDDPEVKTLELIKNRFLDLEKEAAVFTSSFSVVDKLLAAGAKESELKGLKSFQKRVEKQLIKVYNINEEEYNKEGE